LKNSKNKNNKPEIPEASYLVYDGKNYDELAIL
jgi:hypothetical protein